MIAQTVIKDANVITMAHRGAVAQAVAIDKDRILAVGANQEVDALVGPGTTVLHLSGKTVLPGFIDTHVHLMQTGLGALGPNVYGITSARDVLDAVADALAQAERAHLLLLHGCSIGELDRPITRLELDRIARHNPVMISDLGGHACMVNTLAWQELEVPLATGGVKQLDTGEPSGLLVGQANTRARYRFYRTIDDAIRMAALHRAAEMALQRGITTVHALDGGSSDGHGWLPERDVEVLLQQQGDLAVRTVIYFQSTDVPWARERGLPRIGGCLLVDGSYGEHTAALLEPYTDDPTTRGVLYFSTEELSAFVGQAHRASLQVSMHAIGDAAIEQLLDAYERVLEEDPRSNHRHRIEHFSLPQPEHIERVARLGVALAMQPIFAAMPEPGEPEDIQVAGRHLLGPERYQRRHPYRKIVDAGILVAGGSDSDAKPLGPLLGMQAVVNHPDRDRRLTVYEALELFTINAARIAFEEEQKGTVEPGKLADLVVLGDDPLAVDPRTLQDIPVEMTILGGRVVYDQGSPWPE